jgi:N-acetylmuramoyl-L-alanine amidase
MAVSPERPGNVLVQIDTSRIVGYTLNSQPDRLTLDLRIPRNATGALSDKLVVVDAGHGGAATGAAGHGQNGTVYEKTITLAIAMRLRTILEQAGARVVVTRDSDVDIPLYDRPKLANTIGADLFISIHNDSTPHNRPASGTTTYYHSTDPSSRALAVCVQDAVRAVTGLPSKGALSDTVLYASGLAVLRNSTMPAVLCEVAYINNSADRSKLVDPDFQQRVAQAMCDGLKNYVEGRPRPASREVQPGASVPDSITLHNDGPTH